MGLQRLFVQIFPNLPKKFLCNFCVLFTMLFSLCYHYITNLITMLTSWPLHLRAVRHSPNCVLNETLKPWRCHVNNAFCHVRLTLVLHVSATQAIFVACAACDASVGVSFRHCGPLTSPTYAFHSMSGLCQTLATRVIFRVPSFGGVSKCKRFFALPF